MPSSGWPSSSSPEPVLTLPAAVPGPRAARERLQADGVMFLVNLMWGCTFVTVKGALDDGDPFSFLALRFGLGALALSAVARRRVLARATWRNGGLLGVLLFLGYSLQTLGLVSTTPSRSAFITGTCVVLVPVLGRVLLRRHTSRSSWVGVVMATGGLYALSGADLVQGLSRGDVLTLGCALAYAFHILMTERLAPGADVVAMVAVQLWMVGLLSLLCLPLAGARVHWTPAFVGAALFCGVVASALALSLQVWAQARTTAVRVALLSCLEPVFASLCALVLGSEQPGPREWLGGGLIMLGVAVTEVSGYVGARLRAGRAAASSPK